MAILQEVVLVAAACASCAGCSFLLLTWKNAEAPNYVSRRIVTSLGFAGLATAVAFAMSPIVNGLDQQHQKHEGWCYVQALTLQYFYLASYLWTACFAFHLYQIIVKRNEYPEKLLRVYRGLGWGLPGLILVYLVLRQLTGHVGVGRADRPWCWIAVHSTAMDTGDDPLVWQREGALTQFALFYAPVLCVFVFNVNMYHSILKYLHMDPMASRFRRKVTLYLGILLLCSSWGLVNRLLQFLRADHSPNAFCGFLESFFDPVQPFLNALAYGTTKHSIEAFKERCCQNWRWFSSSDDDESSSIDDTPLLPHRLVADPLDQEFGHYFDQRKTSTHHSSKFDTN
ncbi:hypothetical protein CCR75_004813 [Bremia lactucae]|uniref:G-protein coupled receptors family 2 profile 2 domain-containing protein n=1 Tax=Bremia lactucae TaxID=4779 RepID=A0A976IDN4_BRELC|nr:hypothetical protein CCR75_004813 [Bremia lactucae]